MSFLDRFKPQPRWKHQDAAIRAAAVAEIPDDPEHRTVIEELAASDPDARVRNAAIDRVGDVTVLARLARVEQDPELRRRLADRLIEIAIAPAATDADAALALDGLDDPRHFSTIAKSSPHDTVRAASLGRVHDTKALSSIARHAIDPQTALDAVAKISEPAELLNVAMKTEHKDAGVAAVDRSIDPTAPDARETLDTLINRAKSKAVVKRARALLQDIEDAEAARKAALEAWQQRIAGILAKIDVIAASPSIGDAGAQLSEAEAEWRDMSSNPVFELDQETTAQFGALVETARNAIDAHERAEAERRAVSEQDAAARRAREAICARLESTHAQHALEESEKARGEWEGLPGPSVQEAEDERTRERFEEACRRAEERHRHYLAREAVNARLSALSTDAERISSEPQIDQPAWDNVQQEWRSLDGKSDGLDPAVAERYAAAEARVRLRGEERRAAAERAVRQQVQRVDQLIERATIRATAEDLTLREADRLVRDLRTALDTPPALPERELHALGERVKGAQAAITPKLHELREMDEWKRFANAAVQEELIARTEALRVKYGFDTPDGVKTEDVEKAARELHEIQERWKQAAEAPRAQAQALWHRYRQAADPIQAKAREFFAMRSEERKGNLEKKLALIERAEGLAQSTDWIKTAEELKKLQAEWQAIGPVPRQDTRTTWKRFREACDTFFTRRNADLAQRKEVWAANQARKEALCGRAEQLATSMEWDKSGAEIRRLQSEWKTIGPVRRTKSEALWQRFRAACDTFFDRYKRRDQIELEAKQADREALVAELESLAPAGRSDASEAHAPEVVADIAPPAPLAMENTALLERVRSLRNRWNQSTPVVRQGADPLSARFMTGLERLLDAYPDAFRGTELDVEANRQKMVKLCERVEGFLSDVAATPANSSQALAMMLREALAANTIGGRAGEETKWRAMAEDVRTAQASWNRLGPVPGDVGRQLTDRFHRACGRFFDQFRRHMPQQEPATRRAKAVGAR
ncbi:MAG TPA: DUF349 domain-containing protein [Vicinamibacterales bacterium]|nr:DUF349 domain-containing protein [Vicinamibacterales bacterium]